MKLLQNTIIGFRYKHWTLLEVFAYFLKGVAREIKIAPVFFLKYHQKVVGRNFKKKWLKKDDKGTFYFDLNGALLPDISAEDDTFYSLAGFIFDEVFLIPCFYNDNYDKKTVELFDQSMMDIPYCYGNGMFDVTIKKGDIVIDAGAWIGDFSAYAASKGADCYAFEPTGKTYQWLCKTAGLNDKIVPVQKGLGSQSCQMFTTTEDMTGVSNTIVTESTDATIEKIDITTLDEFVKENKLERIDFIKADIEGAEREMLKGATHVLQTFAPKLAICTYHLPDDPEALEKIIMEANPKYKVVHFRQKLFATVVK